MLKDIKRELLLNPQAIVNILETYDFYNPRIHNNEIRCGLSEGHNPTAIRIKLINNDNLFVSDYTRGISYDLINYINDIERKSIPLSFFEEYGHLLTLKYTPRLDYLSIIDKILTNN